MGQLGRSPAEPGAQSQQTSAKRAATSMERDSGPPRAAERCEHWFRNDTSPHLASTALPAMTVAVCCDALDHAAPPPRPCSRTRCHVGWCCAARAWSPAASSRAMTSLSVCRPAPARWHGALPRPRSEALVGPGRAQLKVTSLSGGRVFQGCVSLQVVYPGDPFRPNMGTLKLGRCLFFSAPSPVCPAEVPPRRAQL